MNIDKCEFCMSSLRYLGFVIDKQGLRTDPDKIEAMVEFPRPNTTTEVKRFLGMVSWYRRFVRDHSSLIAPLNSLLKGRK